jgi:hypothetical protein
MLQTSDANAAQVTSQLNVPSGQTAANFTVQTFAVSSSQTVTITASAGGVTRQVTLVLQ